MSVKRDAVPKAAAQLVFNLGPCLPSMGGKTSMKSAPWFSVTEQAQSAEAALGRIKNF